VRNGIAANIILPGCIATDRIKILDERKAKRKNRAVEPVSAESTTTMPVGRDGNPQEHADVGVPGECAGLLSHRLRFPR
jgi:3-oxoacyl-[acyl-carrier protein] reductase